MPLLIWFFFHPLVCKEPKKSNKKLLRKITKGLNFEFEKLESYLKVSLFF